MDVREMAIRLLELGHTPSRMQPRHAPPIVPDRTVAVTPERLEQCKAILREARRPMTAEDIGRRMGIKAAQVGQLLRKEIPGVSRTPHKNGIIYQWEAG